MVEREELIAQLEKFERLASDPNRFFEKGKMCSNPVSSLSDLSVSLLSVIHTSDNLSYLLSHF